jgi:hypothetical protein
MTRDLLHVVRTLAAASTALVLILAIGTIAMAQEEEEEFSPEEVRLDTELGGYTLQASGTPFEILVEEPVTPVPVDPGEPHMSVQTAYTRAQLQTGPSGRGLASSAWPGALLGDGFGTVAGVITGDDAEEYPVMADARYPQGPEEADAELPAGFGMRSYAKGLDVRAQAQTGELPDGVGFAGQYSSDSTSTVQADHVTAHARSMAQDVVLLDGLIRIGNVVTDITSTSMVGGGETAGTTEVSGMTIAGFGYVVDEEGARPVADDNPDGPLPVPSALITPEEVRELLGIEIELLGHTEEVSELEARRRAGGLRISIDTRTLRAAIEEPVLQPIISNIPDFIIGLQLPEEVPIQIPVYSLLFLAPKVDFIFGAAGVTSSAVEQLTLDLDFDLDLDLDDPPPMGDAADLGSFSDGGSVPGGDIPAPTTAGSADVGDFEGGDELAPMVASDDGALDTDLAVALPQELPTGGGVTAGLLALGLLAAAGGSRGLQGITAGALGLAGASAGCDQGHPVGVPDLKGEVT